MTKNELIRSPYMSGVPALIIFGKIHFLLTSETEILHEIESDGITSFHGSHVSINVMFRRFQGFAGQCIVHDILMFVARKIPNNAVT